MAKEKAKEVKTAEAPVTDSTDLIETTETAEQNVVAEEISVDTSPTSTFVEAPAPTPVVKETKTVPVTSVAAEPSQSVVDELTKRVALLESVCVELLEIGRKSLVNTKNTQDYLLTRINQVKASGKLR